MNRKLYNNQLKIEFLNKYEPGTRIWINSIFHKISKKKKNCKRTYINLIIVN
jgi:hypothetical protein